MSIWVKDPADIAWYQIDWADPSDPFLDVGETITAHTITCDGNLTKVADTSNASTVSIQVSGGVHGTKSLITCQIDTSAGNQFKTEKTIFIEERVLLP